MIKLDERFIRQHRVCWKGADFARRNKLLNLKLEDLDKIEGDYQEYVKWLKELPKCEYDLKGNLIKTTSPTGNVCTYEYDSRGNLTREDNAYTGVSLYEYDSVSNLTKKVWEYDGEEGHTTYTTLYEYTYQYSPKGHLTRKVHLGTYTEEYKYDTLGTLTEDHIHKYKYNKGGKLTEKLVKHDGTKDTYRYNPRGFLLKQTCALGGECSYRYNSKGDITKKIDFNGDIFTYKYTKGRLIECTENLTTYEYDSQRETYERVGPPRVFIHKYYENGQLQSVTEEGIVILNIPFLIEETPEEGINIGEEI